MAKRWIGSGLLVAILALAGGCGDEPLGPETRATLLQAVVPAGGSTGVSVGTEVVVTFSNAMRQGMEMLAALHEGPVTGPLVGGTWRWSEDRVRLTFTPSSPLKPATTYTLHIGGGMVDAAGNPIDMGAYGARMGGRWASPETMPGGGWAGGGGTYPMGPGWRHPNGSYGMVFTFTTAA